MKILIISSMTKTATANYLVDAFLTDGHLVYLCSDVNGTYVSCVVKRGFHIKEVLEKMSFEPDILLFIEGGNMQCFPLGLETVSCITAWYGIDTHTNYAKHLRISRLFDVTFVAQKEFVRKLEDDGVEQIFWLPLAFAPKLHPSGDLNRVWDVAYIGSDNADVHPVRHQLLAAIKKQFPNTVSKMASPLEMSKIYAQAYIVFNKSVNNDVNMRYFEAMGSGAVLLTDHTVNNGVEELFDVGKHYIEYSDEDSLLNAISELLNNRSYCQNIANASRENVLNNHTYQHRVKQFLYNLSSCRILNRPAVSDYFSVFIMMRMSQEALLCVEKSFEWDSASFMQKFIALFIKSTLSLIRCFVCLYDFICKVIANKKYRNPA